MLFPNEVKQKQNMLIGYSDSDWCVGIELTEGAHQAMSSSYLMHQSLGAQRSSL